MDPMLLIREASDFCGPDIRFLVLCGNALLLAGLNARPIAQTTWTVIKAPITIPKRIVGYFRKPPAPLGRVAEAVLKALAGNVDVDRATLKDVTFHTILASDLYIKVMGKSIKEMVAGDAKIDCLQHLTTPEQELITAKVMAFVDAYDDNLKMQAETRAAEAVLLPVRVTVSDVERRGPQGGSGTVPPRKDGKL